MNLLLKFGPWIALAAMTALYLGKRDDLATEIEAANTRVMASVAEAEKITREAIEKAADDRIAQTAALALSAQKARDEANEKAEAANMDALKAGQRIRELELEASIDDIPDSSECLNVFVPGRVLYPEACGETGTNPDTGANGVCASAEGINPDNPAFALVTYGDSMKLWLQDRAGLTTCNGQLKAIESLE